MVSASVYYRFKSQKEPSRITFDGTGISVWDLKREIILQNKMGKGIDFDLAVYNQDTEDEYKDDNFFIPRSSQVIVRRLPPSKPGRGTAANYVADLQAAAAANAMAADARAAGIPTGGATSTGAGPGGSGGPMDRRGPMYRGQMSMRFDGRDPAAGAAAGPSSAGAAAEDPLPVQAMSMDQDGEEAAKIAAMFQATTEQWDETQERMAHATYRERGGAPRRGGPPRPMTGNHNAAAAQHHQVSDRPPPIGYTCFRCYKKGHWIHDCPTNDDREFDNKPRLKRTTGIPKSMLKTVEAPTDEMRSQGLMITPDGSYVIAQVDEAEWERNRAQTKVLTRSDIYQSVPSDSSLACPLCSKVLRDAVKTPCCSTTFCEECIQTHLLDHDFTCAECEKRIPDLSELQRDDEKRKAVREYIDSEIEKSERKVEDMEREREEKENGGVAAANKEGGGEGEDGKEGEVKAEEGNNGTNGEVKKEENEEADETAKPTPHPHGLPQKPAEASRILSSPSDGEGEGDQNGEGAEQQPWDPKAAQQIMMMLMNPQLPPPMRMQLQMQLQILRAQFLQANGAPKAENDAKKEQDKMWNGGGGNPFAGQHMGGFGGMGMPSMGGFGGMGGMGGMGMGLGMGGMGMGRMGMGGMGMMGMAGAGGMNGMNGMNNMGAMAGGGNGMNPWNAFQQQQQQQVNNGNPFQPRVPPPTNEESAYMRLPVNQNKRVQGQKRERPTDFLELGGGGGGDGGDKQARYYE